MADIVQRGTVVHTSGELPSEGSKAPDFRLVASDLSDVSLASFRGKVKLLSIVPSLDTGVCAMSARKFNERIADVAGAVVLIVSTDLPFAMKRFCSTEGLDHVVSLSMMRGRNFARDYGVLLVDGPFEGACARAVVVVDAEDRVVYGQMVPDISSEPDYDAALAAARDAVSSRKLG